MIKVTWAIISGLTTSLSTLKETMLPNIGPKNVADTNVRISGHYDPCQYGVSITFEFILKYYLTPVFYQMALTKEECETLAREFRINDITANVSDNRRTPPHCYFRAKSSWNNRLWFNTAYINNSSPCTEERKCVCRKGIYPKSGNLHYFSIEKNHPEGCPI